MLPSVIGGPGGFFRASRDLGCWQADFAGARGGVNVVVG
jgi:hypothetical protein